MGITASLKTQISTPKRKNSKFKGEMKNMKKLKSASRLEKTRWLPNKRQTKVKSTS